MAHDIKVSNKDVMARRGYTIGFGRGKSPKKFSSGSALLLPLWRRRAPSCRMRV